MNKIGIYPNVSKKNIRNITEKIIKWFECNNFSVSLPVDIATHIELSNYAEKNDELLKTADMCITLGGDGTLLNIAKVVAPYDIPILGINLGHLGFLTEVEFPDLFSELEHLKTKKYFIDTRMMLEAEVTRDNRILKSFFALNDVVVTKGPFARLIRLKTSAGGAYIDTYPADGIIISTPTGSTAYSLSAGGPIIKPDMELMLLTPICPHTLQSRSIVISTNDTVKIQVIAEHPEVMVTVDGQQGYELLPGDEVTVKKSIYKTKLVRIKNRSFYDILRKKLSETNFVD
ncbi:MAG: NAD(+)/NADH kinase [Tepidanaerobacteraceae bacterium]